MNKLLVFILLVLAYLYGVISYKYELIPYYQVKFFLKNTVDKVLYRYVGYNQAEGKTQVNCNQFNESTLSIIVLGQSNGANTAKQRLGNVKDVYNYNILDGKCYVASDPLLGTTGQGGTIWTRLGHSIVTKQLVDRVLIIPIAVSGSSVLEWGFERMQLYPRVEMAVKGLRKEGININYVFWQQGESDKSMSEEQYYTKLNDLVRSIILDIPKARIFIADSSYCNGSHSEKIRRANRKVIKNNHYVLAGPDMDQYYSKEYRFDDCHLSSQGIDIASINWLLAIKPYIVKFNE